MQSTPLWRFGPFEADAAEHRLRCDGEIVPVTRKSFALLATLLSRPGKLFTKAELFDLVWAGSVVTDAALSRAIRELRIALGDDAAAPRYIATAHGLGFRFVALVSVERLASEPESRPSPTDQRLVGRDRELALLDNALADARAGKRQIVFVTGEAGIGKTALVEAFIDRHPDSASLWVAQGRCIEQYGTGEAYLPILEALERLARQVGADILRDVLARYAPAWLAQLPWLAHDADAAALRRSASDTTAQRMLRELAHALEVLSVERPIVLWLEDLHWSDPSSLAAVACLAGRREPARLLIVASFRPADAHAAESPLTGLRLQLVQRGQASELALGHLDEAAVAAYLRLRFDSSPALPSQELGAFVHRHTGGNALFIVAMVDDLVRRGVLARTTGAWSLAQSIADIGNELPDSLRHLVHGQMAQLSESDLQLIEAAAVCGTDFSAALLAAALQTGVVAAEDRCADLARQGRFLRAAAPVPWPDGSVASGFGFLHALYWQGTFERVPPGRRAEWQRRIGSAQEEAWGDDCKTIAAELAMRFEAAHDWERSLRYLQMAGATSLARCAYHECIDHLRRAVDLLPRLPAEARARHELDVLLPLGAALMAVQGYASDEVEATYRRALLLCRVCARPGELVRVLRGLWNVVFLRADLIRAQEAAHELLAHAEAGGSTGGRFDALTKIGQTCMHRGDLAGARTNFELALSLPSASDDPARLREAPRATAYLAWVLWHMGLPAQALARGTEALNLSGRAESPHSNAFVLGFISWLHMFCGDMVEARRLAAQQSALSAEHGLVYWRAWADFTLGLFEAREGKVLPGTEKMADALAAMRAMGAEVGIPHFLCLQAEAELLAGRPDRASNALTSSQALMARNGNEQFAADTARLHGHVALAENRDGTAAAQARHRFELAMTIGRRQGARAQVLRAATDLAQLCSEAGECGRAAGLLEPLLAEMREGQNTADPARARALLDSLTRPQPVACRPQ